MAMKEFTVSKQIDGFHIWGGPHTPETSPTHLGWRCHFVWVAGGCGENVHLVGQKGVKVCATLRRIEEGWDAILCFGTPEEVNATKGSDDLTPLVSHGIILQDYPGFGLELIRRIEEWRRVIAD